MALIVADRVRESSTTTGTGTLTLSGSPLGYQTFSSAIGNGNTTYYAISNPGVNEWEVGIGTVGAGTLARTTVLSSSTGTSLVNFTAGNKDVFCTYPAEVSVFSSSSQTLTNKTISVDDNTVSGIAASSFVVSNASGNIDGTAAQKTIPTGDVVGTTDTQTLTNKTITGSFTGNVTGNVSGTASNVTGTVAIANGGTGATTRQNAMDALAGAVTAGQYLRGNGTDVVMSAIQAADVPTLNQNTTGSAATLTTARTISLGGDLSGSASFNGSADVTITATIAANSVALGTDTTGNYVASVATTSPLSGGAAGSEGGALTLSLASGYGDTQNPYASKTANYVLAAPNGTAGVPTFRALAAADIPDLTLEKLPDAWVKKAVRAATTASITLSGTQTIDGIALVAGDRVLVKNQTAAAENGIYTVAAGAWARSADANTSSELAGACVSVDSGTVNGGFRFDTDLKSTDTLGTTAVSFYKVYDVNDAATANTANKLVLRDASGNFSAGTITATLSGNATNVSGTVAIANGGTGATTRQNAMDALAGATTSGYYLRGNGTDVVMSAIQAADVPTLNQNTTGNAGTVTNGVYTVGDQTIGGTKTFSSNPIINSGTANGVAYLNGSKVLTTGSALTFDGSNLGLGVTPSGWIANYKAIEFANGAAIDNYSGDSRIQIRSNSYVGTAFTNYYKVNGTSGIYSIEGNNHYWYTAPSGTAGNAISFTQAMTLDASGNLLVGTTSLAGKLAVETSVSGQAVYRANATDASYASTVFYGTTTRAANAIFDFIGMYANSVGQFRVNGAGTIYAQNTTVQSISDVRLKENIKDSTDGLDIITSLRPVRYDWKEGYGNDRKNQLGFIAQEVEPVFPEAVSEWQINKEDETKYKTVGPGALIPVLVRAIQELKAELDATKAEVAALKGV